MKVFVTSDIISIDPNQLKQEWNSLVSETDEIFILGNFGKNFKHLKFIIDELNGKKGFFIASPDDKLILEYHQMNPPVNNNYRVFGLPFVNMPNGCLLSYWPFFDWDEQDKGKIQYYGKVLPDANDLQTLLLKNAVCASWQLNKTLVEIKQSYV